MKSLLLEMIRRRNCGVETIKRVDGGSSGSCC